MLIRSCTMPDSIDNRTLAFCFHEGKLLVHGKTGEARLPLFGNLSPVNGDLSRWHYLGELDGTRCICTEWNAEIPIPDDFEFCEIRPLHALLGSELWHIAGYARQILDWDRNFRYCGRCSQETAYMKTERARICHECGLINHPRISPAMIVAVFRDDSILLARGKRFHLPWYSTLAGFVEPGENLEECVAREVREEVGIEIENIRYFSSQSWPFPDSLMVAFFADYKSGEITIDTDELIDAGWFDADHLPLIPAPGSISRSLIDYFIAQQEGSRVPGDRD